MEHDDKPTRNSNAEDLVAYLNAHAVSRFPTPDDIHTLISYTALLTEKMEKFRALYAGDFEQHPEITKLLTALRECLTMAEAVGMMMHSERGGITTGYEESDIQRYIAQIDRLNQYPGDKTDYIYRHVYTELVDRLLQAHIQAVQ